MGFPIKILVCFVFCICSVMPMVQARVGEVPLNDSISVQTITSSELEQLPTRDLSSILKLTPQPMDQRIRREDAGAARDYFQANLDGIQSITKLPTDPDIKSFLEKSIINTRSLVDLYGAQHNALSSAVNIITTSKPLDLSFAFRPSFALPETYLTEKERAWQGQNMQIGRLGYGGYGGQYAIGYRSYQNDQWSWNSGWKAGEYLGIGGPIIAIGETKKGPALTVFDAHGYLIGDVTKDKLKYDPGITAKYVLEADYASRLKQYNFMPSASYNLFSQVETERLRLDIGTEQRPKYQLRGFDFSSYEPRRVMMQPLGRRYGDLIQMSGVLNNRLTNFNNRYDDYFEDYDDYDEYDDYDDYDEYDDGCMPSYTEERVYPRVILADQKEANMNPDDPLYSQLGKKTKKPAIPNVIGGLFSVGKGVLGMGGGGIEEDRKGPDVKDQYYLPKIGFTPKEDPKSAWNVNDFTQKNVIVAVIDSGLDLSHPDGPQYVMEGWNFLAENNDVTDEKGHGTLVAGIIAARSNNGIGIAGINPGAVILPLKVADKNGNTNSLAMFRAIHYAIDKGAKVINMSLGGKGLSKLEMLAINRARANGILVVTASGNDGENISMYGPASLGGTISVGAMNYDGSRATISNAGANNSLMAPGEEIYSLHSKDAKWDGPAGDRERLYTKASGTSFAAPMVAAAASLLYANDPNVTADMVEDKLLSNANRLGGFWWDEKTGAGVLDAAKALTTPFRLAVNVKITGLKITRLKANKIKQVDVYATVAGAVESFTVEIGKGENAKKFEPIIGFDQQKARHNLVARLPEHKLKGSKEWTVQVRAVNKEGKEFIAKALLNLK